MAWVIFSLHEVDEGEEKSRYKHWVDSLLVEDNYSGGASDKNLLESWKKSVEDVWIF